MNRSTSLLLAFGALIAHALVLFQDALGRLAHPFDDVHIAFQMARNLVRTGSAAFNASGPLLESYPSPAWVALAAVADRLYLGPNVLAQAVAALSALGLVWAVSRFSPDRLAGVMAPMFVVASGSVACSIGGGSEWATFALLCTLGLLFLEEGRPRAVAITCSLAVLVRPEGLLLTLALAALSVASRLHRRPATDPRPGQTRVGVRAFAIPVVVFVALGLLRLLATGAFLPPVLLDALTPDAARFAAGSRTVVDFALRSGAMSLTVVPVAFVLVGRLSPRGRRALVVGLAWIGWVAWQGGHRLPMWQAFVPAIPFLAVAIQEALTRVVDHPSVWMQRAAWATFLAGLTASVIVSKRPSDLGPIPLDRVQRAWMANPAMVRLFGHESGRLGLVERIAEDERLRCAAIFVRDRMEADVEVATLWPGALGYLSGRTVVDLSGRATVGPEGRIVSDWGPTRIDLVAALRSEPQYLMPPVEIDDGAETVEDLARAWLVEFDRYGAEPGRVEQLAAILDRYELVAVPIPVHSSMPTVNSLEPLRILRHERIASPTELDVEVADGRVEVLARHDGHQQIGDLVVERIAKDGSVTRLAPDGAFVDDERVHARSHVLLFKSGWRWVRMISAPIDLDGVAEIRASLAPPGAFDFAGRRSARVEASWRPDEE
ncbi:MAG: hypothetical protein R3F34_11590 [Planctomycetota bacterium]